MSKFCIVERELARKSGGFLSLSLRGGGGGGGAGGGGCVVGFVWQEIGIAEWRSGSVLGP